jgi:hypothetical protein
MSLNLDTARADASAARTKFLAALISHHKARRAQKQLPGYYLDADQRKTFTVLENAFMHTTNKEIVARMMTLLPCEARNCIYQYLAWDASFLAQVPQAQIPIRG